MNVRLRMYEYCYSNLSAIYAKGLCGTECLMDRTVDVTLESVASIIND